MGRTEALQRNAQKIRDAWNSWDHPHDEGPIISVSRLVSQTAYEHAKTLLRWKRGEEEVNNHNPFWTMRGDTLAGASLEDVDHEEVKVTLPLDVGDAEYDWVLEGHLDGAEVIEDGGELWLVVDEHKVHNNVGEAEVEKARRQGTLYLGLFWYVTEHFDELEGQLREHGITNVHGDGPTFPLADWVLDPDLPTYNPDAVELTIPFGTRPAGVNVPAIEATSGPQLHSFECDEEELQQWLDNVFFPKALAIIRSVEEEDLSRAEEWDTSTLGLTEFSRGLESVNEAKAEEIEELADEYQSTNERIKELEEQKKKLNAEMQRWLSEHETEKFECEDFSVVLQKRKGRRHASVKDLEEAGLDEFIKRGSPYQFCRVYDRGG